ncbi:MAG: hypothetical protein AB7P21_26960 [Lautropia sp.]
MTLLLCRTIGGRDPFADVIDLRAYDPALPVRAGTRTVIHPLGVPVLSPGGAVNGRVRPDVEPVVGEAGSAQAHSSAAIDRTARYVGVDGSLVWTESYAKGRLAGVTVTAPETLGLSCSTTTAGMALSAPFELATCFSSSSPDTIGYGSPHHLVVDAGTGRATRSDTGETVTAGRRADGTLDVDDGTGRTYLCR